MKTISMRIRGAKTELEDAGESTEGMVESTAKLREEIKALSGVDIMLNEDTFKSTYQIMDELSAKWENLSDIQQATIIELMAGKHQGNVFSSLMANFDTARAALETSLNSSGSAMEEHAKWSDSLQARLNKLKATWQSLSQTFLKSDFLKVGIGGITGFIDVIDNLIDKIGVIPTLLSGYTLLSPFFNNGKSFGLFSALNTELSGITNKIGILGTSFAKISGAFKIGSGGSGFTGFLNGLKSVKNVTSPVLTKMDIANIKEYNNLIDQCVTPQTAWYRTMQNSSVAAQNMVAGANGGKVALQGLTAAANTSKVAMLGLKVATAALNVGLTLAISALISYGIKKFDEWHESADELAERIKNVTEDYKSQHNELMKLKGDYDTTSEDSMISKYGELSKGVNSLGENLSLTADEYAEYQNIVSKIASQNPNIVKGYNSQGQAILECAGDIDKLAQSYKDLVIEENNKVTDIGADIFKDFQNDLKDTSAYYQESYNSDKPTRIKYNESPISEHYDTKHLDKLQELMELSGKNDEEFNNAIENLTNDEINRLSDLLEEQGIERNKFGSGDAGWETKRQHVINALKGDKKEIKNVLDGAAADLNAYAEDMGTVTEAFFNTAFLGGNGKEIGDYSDISEKMQNAITQATSGLGADFYTKFLDPNKTNEQNYQEFINYYNDVLNKFKNLDDADAAKFEAAFDLKTKFNGGDISYGEYVKGIQEAGNIVDGMELGDELTAQIQLALNTEEVSTDYDALEKKFTEKYELEMETEKAQKKAEEFLNGLSASEYSVAIDLIVNEKVNFDDFSDIKSLREYIEKQAKLKEAMNYTIAINAETESVEALNTAMSESVSGAGLSSEAIAALKDRYSELASEGYDLSSMFEETANGIHLNKDAVGDLEQAYASNKLSETKAHLDTLKNRYTELEEEIKNCTDASERAALYREQQSITQKINDLGTLAAQYQGLASAYNAWQSAESGGNERDMYESVISGFETIEDELSRGWLDDGTIKFLELMTGETNLAGESASKLRGIWDGLDEKIKGTSYSVKDFFTTNKDGESTSTGVYNFLRAVQELESSHSFKNVKGDIKDLVQMEDGKVVGFNFDIVGGDEAIAEALGISEELVQIILRAADDAGFVVTLDGNWTQFADLKIAAEEANGAIKELALTNDDLKSAGFGEYDFNFGASSIEDINKELDKAKELLNNSAFKGESGRFDIDKKGAKDALKIAETLQIAKNKAEEPIYMSVDTTKLEKDLQEPVKKLQEFETLRQEKNLLNLTGTDQKRIEEINTELDTLTNELLALPDEVKTDLGINDDDYESLREKLESGKIDVPAQLTIEANMDKNLEDLVTLGLFEKGFISEEEAKIRLNANIEPKINNPEAVGEAVDEVVNNEGGKTETTTVTQDVEVETGEVKTESNRDKIWNNVKNWWNNFWGVGESESTEKLEAETDVEIKPQVTNPEAVGETVKNEVETGKDGQLTYRQDFKLEPDVDTSGAAEEIKENTSEAIENQSGEVTTLEQDVALEFNISEYTDELSKFKDVATELDGLDDVELTITANFEGTLKDSSNVENLTTFAEAAKNLKGISKDTNVTIKANAYGNVLKDKESKFENLKTFAEGAKALSEVKVKENSVSVTANFDGSLASWNGDINTLVEFANAAKTLKDVSSNPDVTVTASVDGNAITEEDNLTKLNNFIGAVKNAQATQNVDISVKASVDTKNIEKAIEFLTKVSEKSDLFKNYDSSITVTSTVTGDDKVNTLKVNLDGLKGNNPAITVTVDAGAAIDTLDKIIEKLGLLTNKEIVINTNGDLQSSGEDGGSNISSTGTINYEVGEVKKPKNAVATGKINYEVGKVDEPKDKTVEGTINYEVGEVNEPKNGEANTEVNAKVNYIHNGQDEPFDLEAGVSYKWNSQDPPETPKESTVNYIRGYQQPPKPMIAKVTYLNSDGSGGANGTANANGTAFANGTTGLAFKHGDWGTKGSGIALMGELGRETIVRDGRFFTVGDNGAGFYPYKKGDIIFNHKQTEELFKYGKVTSGGGRGKALASGTAFAEGTAFSKGSGGGMQPTTEVVATNSVTGKDYTRQVGEGVEDFQETIDLIEIAIDRIERAIDSLDAKASNIYKSWSERNEALVNQISKVGEEIDIQQKAYDKYMEAAGGVGLSDDWIKRIQDGDIDIKTIKDEALKQQVDDYKDYYEKALDCKEAIEELKETESELYAQRVENAGTRYEGILGVIEHEKNMIEEYINQSEEQAWLVSAKYYDALANNERERIVELEKQKAAMLEEFNAAMNSGAIAEGSEGYYEMVSSIDEVTQSIAESNTQLLEYAQTLQQLEWEVFDLLQDKISAVAEETEFLIDLMSNKKLYDDDGKLTNEGSATMGLHGVAYNTYMHQSEQAAAEAEKLKKQLESDPYDTELEERYREMIELQQEYILNAEGEKDAIKDLVEEGIQLEIEALEERIDKYNESLDSAKELYEHQKKIKEQTEEIASLEKQMSAYAGDNSEEAKAKIQELKVSLEEAKAELEEAEYDKYIEDAEKLLDNLLLEYEEFYNTRIDNIDALISDMITEINTDAGIIGDTIRESADSVGYTLSDSMKTIWSEDAASTKNVITTYGDKFVNAQTTTNNALNAINANLQNMIAQLNKKASTNVKSANTSSVAKSSDASKTTAKATTTKKSSGGDGKPKIGDRVKYESGQYYYDSQGKKPLGSHKKGEYVYITNINTKDWATHGYHISTGNKLGNGDLGWLKLNQISGYATGAKKILSDELAWTQENGTEFIVRPSDGAILTPVSKNDKVFSASASNNLWNMANSPAEFIRDNLNLGTSSMPNNSTIQSNYTQHLDKVVFNLPNVKNYDELLSALRDDRNFERLIHSITFDKMTGKNSLSKGKSIR